MNRTYFFFLACCLCFLFSCKKKDADLTSGFIKYFGGADADEASQVEPTSDGGYILIGTTKSAGNGGSDMYIVKTNSAGNKEWEKTLGGLLDDEGSSVQQTSDGGYIFLGTYRYPGPGLDSNKADFFVIKTNSNGDTLWTKKYGDFTGIKTNEEGISVKQTMDGGYIIAGNTDAGTDGDMVVLKLNSSGSMMDYGQHPTAVAQGLDQAVSILQQPNGQYVLSSYSGSTGLKSPRTILLSTNLPSPAINSIDKASLGEPSMLVSGEVDFTNDGQFVLTGKTNDDNIFLVKFSDAVSNAKTWFKIFGGTGMDAGSSVQATSDGGYIILGSTASVGAGGTDIYLIKTDASGNEEWTKTFGGAGVDVGKTVRETSDGGYILLGTLEFGDDPSDKDNIICLIKVNSKGETHN
jgi:hypothetical protein